MSYWLFHQWAPRWLRLWIWALIISVISAGPIGLIGGLMMGVICIPLGLFWNFMNESWEWSSNNASMLGAKPSDKLKMCEWYRP